MTDATRPTDVWEWLEQIRGLCVEHCSDLGFRAAEHPRLGRGVAMAYAGRDGARYAEKFRPLGEKTFRWHPREAEHGLWNLAGIADPDRADLPIVITEGEFDAASCVQAGFVRACSVPDGWSETADSADGAKMRPILAAEDVLRNSPCVIVAADADATGEAFARAIGALLTGHPVRVARWPEGCKDANDVLRKHGAGDLAKAINAARMIDPPGGMITGFGDLPPLAERRIMRCGIEPLDSGLAFEECALSVCTGRPGDGKSTFLRFAAHHLTRNEGIRVGAMELEGSPAKMRDHLARLSAGAPWEHLAPSARDALVEHLDTRWRIAHRAPQGDFTENLEWLRQRIHTLAVRDRCKFIYVDPWNELEHMPEPGESMTNYINFATRCLRQWAERYDTHVCMVAHPKKIQDGHVPDGYDIADSAAWANKPALGFTVAQKQDMDGGDVVAVHVWKVRDVERYGFGRRVLEMEFDPIKMVYRRAMR